MSIAEKYRKELEKIGDYPIRSNSNWFAVFPDKLKRLQELAISHSRKEINLVLYRTNEIDARDHYSIPFSHITHLFQDGYLTHSDVNGSVRWNCTIKEGALHVSHSGQSLDVSIFHRLRLELESNADILPEQIEETKSYVEGRATSIIINRYERDSAARAACIRAKGHSCVVCGFSFEAQYGPSMRGFIHVHHLYPLHLTDSERVVVPETDLVPVCPNCHAVIHSQKIPLSIIETQQLLRDQKANKSAHATARG